ncbi:hypothetical protein D918_01523 [Trichuris suis]|nr:hypothetical protein M513_04938 [Trichuris suis]KHJ48255.1 hypothetical protein D918_01523 [Trichuris suis]
MAGMELSVGSSRELAIISPAGRQRKKRKPVVLEEDEYIDKLGKIIQRDFFPDLERLRTQNEYLSALERNDMVKIRQLQMRFSVKRTDQTIPGDFASAGRSLQRSSFAWTPRTLNEGDGPAKSGRFTPPPDQLSERSKAGGTSLKRSKSLEDLNLDRYLQRYTSEDNASFEEIIEAQEAEMRRKKAWMFDAEEAHASKHTKSLALRGADEQLMLPAPTSPKSLDNWTYKAKNAVMFVPDGVDWTPEEMEKRAKMSERVICHKNTRLEEDPFPANADSSKQSLPADFVPQMGFKNPLQQFSYVVTPSPVPGLCESPLMTWGEIEGTPFRLDAGDTQVRRTPGPNFKIPEVPLRDQLAMSMTDEISKKYRRQKKAARETAASLTPKFASVRSSERLASMSPAAQRLASSKLGIRVPSEKRFGAAFSPASPALYKGTTPKPETPSTPLESSSSVLSSRIVRKKTADYS